MRLIDADELKLSHCKECTLYPNKCMGKDCDWGSIAHINMMPTIDAVPVRHAYWIRHEDWEEEGGCGWECSECGMGSEVDYKYCMRCGARMDEDETD